MNNLKRTSSHNNNNSSNHNIIHPTSPDSSLALIRSADIYQNSISEQRPNESLLDYWTRRENEVAQRAQRQSYLEQRSIRKMKKNGSSAGQPRNQSGFHEDAAAAAAVVAVVATTTDSTNTNSNSNSQLSLSYSNCQEAGTGITITSSHNVQFRDLEEDAYSSFDDDDDDDDLKIKDIIERDLESPHWVKKEDKQLLNEGAGVVPVDSLIFTGSGEGLNDVMMSQFSSEDPSDTDLDAWQKEGGTSAPNLHVDLEKCSWSLLEEHLVYLSKRTDLILPSLLQIDHSHGNATPLHTACWKAPPPLALHMISLLPRIYQHMEHVCVALDTDGNTALHLCAANICQDFQNQKRSSQSAYCTEKNSDIYRHVQYKEEEEEEVIGDQYCNIPGFRGEDVLEALVLSAPRALTIQNKEGDTPLHLAVSSSFSTPHAVSLLTDGTSRACFLQDCTGATPLHAAIANNVDERVLSVLLDAAPDTAQIPDNQGLLPLHYVAAFSHTPIAFVRNLIKIYPHAISAQTVDGDTPLHLAISNCKSEDELTISTVQLLLGNHDVNDRRSPLFIENNEKLIPLSCCAVFDVPVKVKEILVQHCLDHGPNDEASVLSLRETVKLPSAEIIHEALREDRVQDVNDSRGETLYTNRNTASSSYRDTIAMSNSACKPEQRSRETPSKHLGRSGTNYYLSGIVNIHPPTTTVQRIERLTELFPDTTKRSRSIAKDNLPLQIANPQIISLAKSLALPIFITKR